MSCGKKSGFAFGVLALVLFSTFLVSAFSFSLEDLTGFVTSSSSTSSKIPGSFLTNLSSNYAGEGVVLDGHASTSTEGYEIPLSPNVLVGGLIFNFTKNTSTTCIVYVRGYDARSAKWVTLYSSSNNRSKDFDDGFLSKQFSGLKIFTSTGKCGGNVTLRNFQIKQRYIYNVELPVSSDNALLSYGEPVTLVLPKPIMLTGASIAANKISSSSSTCKITVKKVYSTGSASSISSSWDLFKSNSLNYSKFSDYKTVSALNFSVSNGCQAELTSVNIKGIYLDGLPHAVNGECGSAARRYFSGGLASLTSASEGLCSLGSVSNFASDAGIANWNCTGLNNGANITCSAREVTERVDGQCGSASKLYSYEDTRFAGANFCLEGIQIGSPSFPTYGQTVSWNCTGFNSGSVAVCNASRLAVASTFADYPNRTVSVNLPSSGITLDYATTSSSSRSYYKKVATNYSLFSPIEPLNVSVTGVAGASCSVIVMGWPISGSGNSFVLSSFNVVAGQFVVDYPVKTTSMIKKGVAIDKVAMFVTSSKCKDQINITSISIGGKNVSSVSVPLDGNSLALTSASKRISLPLNSLPIAPRKMSLGVSHSLSGTSSCVLKYRYVYYNGKYSSKNYTLALRASDNNLVGTKPVATSEVYKGISAVDLFAGTCGSKVNVTSVAISGLRTSVYSESVPVSFCDSTEICSTSVVANASVNTQKVCSSGTCYVCNAGYQKDGTACIKVDVVHADAICGASNRTYGVGDQFDSSESALCINGTANPASVTLSDSNGATASWFCNSTDGGSNVSCSATRTSSPVAALCGIANGTSVYVAPSSNLCSIGENSSVVLSENRFIWNCTGLNNGANVSCYANKVLISVVAQCGNASGRTYALTDSRYAPFVQCASGDSTNASFPSAGTRLYWNCTGDVNATGCNATRGSVCDSSAIVYTPWSVCNSSGKKTRTVSYLPPACTGTSLSLVEDCTYVDCLEKCAVTKPSLAVPHFRSFTTDCVFSASCTSAVLESAPSSASYDIVWKYNYKDGTARYVCGCDGNTTKENHVVKASASTSDTYSLTRLINDTNEKEISTVDVSVAYYLSDGNRSNFTTLSIDVSYAGCTSECTALGLKRAVADSNPMNYQVCERNGSTQCFKWGAEHLCSLANVFDEASLSCKSTGVTDTCTDLNRPEYFCNYSTKDYTQSELVENKECGVPGVTCHKCANNYQYDSAQGFCVLKSCVNQQGAQGESPCSLVSGICNNSETFDNASSVDSGCCNPHFKCFKCNTGYHVRNGTCVSNNCTGGFEPVGFNFTKGASSSNNSLTNLTWRFVTGVAGACEWNCSTGFELNISSNNSCKAREVASCSSLGGICSSSSVNHSHVDSFGNCSGSQSCYVCSTGYILQGNSCVVSCSAGQSWNGIECVANLSGCNGCLVSRGSNVKCVGNATTQIVRANIDGKKMFCNPATHAFVATIQVEGVCQVNAQCDTNLCVNGKCVDVVTEVNNARGFLKKVVCWIESGFRRGDAYNACLAGSA